MLHEFHSIIMGDIPEKLDEYLLKYEKNKQNHFATE